MLDRRRFICRAALVAAVLAAPAFAQTGKKYVCPPCGCGEDHKEYDKPGACPACGMPLVEKRAAEPAPAPAQSSSPQTTPQKGDAASAKPDGKPPASPTPPQ